MKKWNNRIAIVLALMLTMTSVAYARDNQVQKTLHYSNIKIILNGEDITPENAEPFIIDGSTYLPVRAVSEALGLDVEWDGTTQTVKLSSDEAEVEQPAKPEPEKKEEPEPIKETEENDDMTFNMRDLLLYMGRSGIDIEAMYLCGRMIEDPDCLLGTPGNCIVKGTFRCSGKSTEKDGHGSIEGFDNAANCEARYELLSQTTDEYLYKTDYAILRIDRIVAESQAEQFNAVFQQFVGNKIAVKVEFGAWIPKN